MRKIVGLGMIVDQPDLPVTPQQPKRAWYASPQPSPWRYGGPKTPLNSPLAREVLEFRRPGLTRWATWAQAMWRGIITRRSLLRTEQGIASALMGPVLTRVLQAHQLTGVRWLHHAWARGGGIVAVAMDTGAVGMTDFWRALVRRCT